LAIRSERVIVRLEKWKRRVRNKIKHWKFDSVVVMQQRKEAEQALYSVRAEF
jgi:hypothetical protein